MSLFFCWWGESSNKADGGQDWGDLTWQTSEIELKFIATKNTTLNARVWGGKIHLFEGNPMLVKYVARLRKTPAQSLFSEVIQQT